MDYNAVEQLFASLLRGPVQGNEVNYKTCEDMYMQSMQSNPDAFVAMHMEVIQKSSVPAMKKGVATLLCTQIMKGKNAVYQRLSQQFRQNFDASILQVLSSESDTAVISKMCTLMATVLGAQSKLGIYWTEAIDLLLQWVFNGDAAHKKIAFQTLSGDVVFILEDQQLGVIMPKLYDSITLGLGDTNPEMKQLAVQLYSSVVQSVEDDKMKETLVKLLPVVMQRVADCLMNDSVDDELKGKFLTSVDEMVEEGDACIEPYVPSILETCIGVCRSNTAEFDLQESALCVIETLCKSYRKQIKNNMLYTSAIFQVIVEWLLTVQETKEWLEGEDVKDELPRYDCAMGALYEIGSELGAASLVNYVSCTIGQLIGGSWQQKHVALIFLFTACRVSMKTVQKASAQIYNLIFSIYKDETQINKYYIIVILNKLYKADTKTRSRYLDASLNVAIEYFSEQHRVVERSCDFISYIIDHTDVELLSTKYDAIIRPLVQLLMTGPKGVVTEALCAVSFIALRMKKGFIPYYQDIVTVLRSMLGSTGTDEQYFAVKGRVIECLSVIGMSLKDQYCEECAGIIIQELQRVLAIQGLSIDNPLFGFIESSCTRLAEILKERFAPFLPTIVEICLRRARLCVVSTNSKGEGIETLTVNGKSVAVHTAMSEEKRNAVNALSDFANDLDVIMYKYAQHTLETVLPLVKDPYDDGLRELSARCVFRLIRVLVHGRTLEVNSEETAKRELQPTILQCMEVLLQQIIDERYVETSQKLMEAARWIANFMGTAFMTQESIAHFFTAMNDVYINACRRIKDDDLSLEEAKEEDDEEALDRCKQRISIETDMRRESQRLVDAVCRTHGMSVFSTFQSTLLNQIKVTLSNPKSLPTEKVYAISLAATVAVCTGEEELVQQVMTLLLTMIRTGENVITNTIVLCTMLELPIVARYVGDVLNVIQPSFSLKQTRPKQYSISILCFGKCILAAPSMFNEQYVSNWVKALPTAYNTSETLSLLCEMIAKFVERKHINSLTL